MSWAAWYDHVKACGDIAGGALFAKGGALCHADKINANGVEVEKALASFGGIYVSIGFPVSDAELAGKIKEPLKFQFLSKDDDQKSYKYKSGLLSGLVVQLGGTFILVVFKEGKNLNSEASTFIKNLYASALRSGEAWAI